MENSNLKKGLAREIYVFNILKFKNKWNVYKANVHVDKYKNIDFICFNKNNQKIMVQVKGIKYFNMMKNKQINVSIIKKTLDYSIKHDAILYYAFIEISKKTLFFMKVVNYENTWWC